MSCLEELLPKFRKGAKIRRKDWPATRYICFENGNVCNEEGNLCRPNYFDIFEDSWELYQEPVDWNYWDYIIKHKCLCWFWDHSENYKVLGVLIEVDENKKLCRYICKKSNGTIYDYANCRPVRKDEVTFYEDKEDD